MKVFQHHLYEYRKGLRKLILHTIPAQSRERVEAKLERLGIAYEIYVLSNGHMNVFFGAHECVEVIRSIGKSHLKDYSPQEDFILGTMLGYDRQLQCRRYLDLVAAEQQARQGPAGNGCQTIPIQTRRPRGAEAC